MPKTPLPNKYFEEPGGNQLELLRNKAREKRRITFDCFTAIVKGNDPEKVICKRGYRLGGHRTISVLLLSVLRGRASKVCQRCPDYDSGGQND